MTKFLSKNMILFTIILMDLLTGMEFDLFVPSFPELQNHFGLSPSWVAATLSVNFIGYCVSLCFLGDLSDRYGRKPIILAGLMTFVIGSVFCVWPLSYEFLLLGRFLQGLGIAAPAILSFLIIADAYPIKEQQFLMGMLNGAMNIAVAAAPIVGSYVALYFHWQGNFALLLLLGFFVLAMTILCIPRDKQVVHQASVSLAGLKGYIVIFKSKPLVLLMVNLLFIFIPYWIFVGMSPLLYMKALGVSLSHFGYYQGILALVFAIGSILFGFMIKQVTLDQKRLLQVTIQIFLVSLVTIGLATFWNTSSPLFITLAILVFIVGQIIPTTILYPICLNFIPEAKGRVSAIIQGARLILTAIVLQITSYLYDGSFYFIGIVMLSLILVAIITLIFVMKHRTLMSM